MDTIFTAHADLTAEIPDLATKSGTYVMKSTSVEGYLKMLALYDPANRTVQWDEAIHADFQRVVIPLAKNPIKRRMFRDLLRGSTVPPVVLYERSAQRPVIVDGLQRTNVMSEALKVLLMQERGEKVEKFAADELNSIAELGQKVLSVEDFLKRPVIYQLWRNLDPDELVRLFMVLNVGQQKVSPRHLLEVMGQELQEMFKNWELPILSERQEKELKQRKLSLEQTLGMVEPKPVAGQTHFKFEYLLDGLFAYVTRDPQVKTSKVLQETGDETPRLSLDERIAEIGSEACKADFSWACRDLNDAIKTRYADDASWRWAIPSRDNFFIPLMAALGDARHDEQARSALEDRKSKLVELIKGDEGGDPLCLSRSTSNGLAPILSEIKSNIGRRQRGVVYLAWRRYFRLGLENPDYPVDWRTASVSM